MSDYTYWTVYIYGSAGDWEASTAIRRPNDNLTVELESTQQKVQLADGSFTYINPETKSMKQPLTFLWLFDDGTLKTQLETYVNNSDYLKIVTHSGETFIGRFLNVSRVWLTGIGTDTYDITATFEQME